MQYFLNTKPIPLARPRIGKFGGYNPQAKQIESAKLELMAQGARPTDTCAHLKLVFEIPMPKTWSAKLKADSSGTPHTSRPDIDNLIKFILDAGNNVLWEDDAIISVLSASKVWASVGRTCISLEP